MNGRRKYIDKIYKHTDIVLFHVPKTSGTTIASILRKSSLEFVYIHMSRQKITLAFEYIRRVLEDPNKKVIITWRSPTEHVLSSFNFYAQYQDIKIPDNLGEFILDPLFQNMQTNFLTHTNFLQSVTTTEDFTLILRLLERPNTFFVLTDYIDEGIEKLSKFVGIPLCPTETKRFNYNKIAPYPSFEIQEEIEKYNDMDMKIYLGIIKKYGYSTKSLYSDIVLHDPPPYFPYCWLTTNDMVYKNIDCLKTIQSDLLDSPNLSEVSVKEYVDKWLNKAIKYPCLTEDAEYYPISFNDLMESSYVKDRITSNQFYGITKP